MKRLVILSLLKTLFITVGSSLLYILYGLISNNPFKITLEFEIIFFLGVFFTSLIEYVWQNRKKKRNTLIYCFSKLDSWISVQLSVCLSALMHLI